MFQLIKVNFCTNTKSRSRLLKWHSNVVMACRNAVASICHGPSTYTKKAKSTDSKKLFQKLNKKYNKLNKKLVMSSTLASHSISYTMYSKECIRFVLDALHLINVDQVDLLVAVEVLDYLHFEGKTILSDFERRLSKSIIQALIRMKLPASTQIVLCFAISSTDNYDNSYELSVGSKLNKMTDLHSMVLLKA